MLGVPGHFDEYQVLCMLTVSYSLMASFVWKLSFNPVFSAKHQKIGLPVFFDLLISTYRYFKKFRYIDSLLHARGYLELVYVVFLKELAKSAAAAEELERKRVEAEEEAKRLEAKRKEVEEEKVRMELLLQSETQEKEELVSNSHRRNLTLVFFFGRGGWGDKVESPCQMTECCSKWLPSLSRKAVS